MNPLKQLPFREPEPGLWWCKRTIYFAREGKDNYVCAPGQPIVVIERLHKRQESCWKVLLPMGDLGYVNWRFDVNRRWSKFFFMDA